MAGLFYISSALPEPNTPFGTLVRLGTRNTRDHEEATNNDSFRHEALLQGPSTTCSLQG